MVILPLPPKILGPDGQAISSAALQQPQTSHYAHLQRELQTHPTRGLTPSKLAAILDQAEQGDLQAQFDLFEDMEEKTATSPPSWVNAAALCCWTGASSHLTNPAAAAKPLPPSN